MPKRAFFFELDDEFLHAVVHRRLGCYAYFNSMSIIVFIFQKTIAGKSRKTLDFALLDR